MHKSIAQVTFTRAMHIHSGVTHPLEARVLDAGGDCMRWIHIVDMYR